MVVDYNRLEDSVNEQNNYKGLFLSNTGIQSFRDKYFLQAIRKQGFKITHISIGRTQYCGKTRRYALERCQERSDVKRGKYWTWSIPKFRFQSHSLVHNETNSYFFGIGPISDVDLTCIFRTVSPLYMLHQIQVSVLQNKILIHICFQILLS